MTAIKIIILNNNNAVIIKVNIPTITFYNDNNKKQIKKN